MLLYGRIKLDDVWVSIGTVHSESGTLVFFFQAEDGIRYGRETGVQTCALPICPGPVIQCLPIGGHLASRGENLAGRTNVNVTLLVECEVFPTERSVFSLR